MKTEIDGQMKHKKAIREIFIMNKSLKKTTLAALCSFAIGVSGTALVSTPSEAGTELRALTWEGYTDPSVIDVFTEKTGCTLVPTYVGSNDEITAKMAAGGSGYDVISPAVDNSQLMAGMGVLEPLDPARLEHFGEIYASFRDHPGVQADGKIWSMPMAWGSIPLMYRTDKFDSPPTSATVLFDPKYKGKIGIQNVKSSMYLTARIIYGADFDVYDMNDEQLEAVKQKMIAQKPLVRTYWSSAGELIELYANGEIWVSETWGGYQVSQLREMGIPVAELLPDEKADGWQDVWNIVKGSENIDCAYQWINFISGPDGQCGMVRVAGYSAANPSAVADCLTDEVKRDLHLDDLDYADGLDFWKLPPRIGKYVEVWNEILAAE
jgi:putative spermidine/putrescine transport system substrate-binding protein/spermidine/putrescine transport system substrate-binding protein